MSFFFEFTAAHKGQICVPIGKSIKDVDFLQTAEVLGPERPNIPAAITNDAIRGQDAWLQSGCNGSSRSSRSRLLPEGVPHHFSCRPSASNLISVVKKQ